MAGKKDITCFIQASLDLNLWEAPLSRVERPKSFSRIGPLGKWHLSNQVSTKSYKVRGVLEI